MRRTAHTDVSVEVEIFAYDLRHPLVGFLFKTLGNACNDRILADERNSSFNGASYMLCRKSEYDEIRILNSFLICFAEVVVTFEFYARKVVFVLHVCSHACKVILINIENVDPAAFACKYCRKSCTEASSADK